MTEPEYIFVKGQGWILGAPDEYITIESKYGTYTLIKRKPVPGERAYLIHNSYPGEVTLMEASKNMKDSHYDSYVLITEDNFKYYDDRYKMLTLLVTNARP